MCQNIVTSNLKGKGKVEILRTQGKLVYERPQLAEFSFSFRFWNLMASQPQKSQKYRKHSDFENSEDIK